MRIHVISDLEYWVNEFAEPVEGEFPDCDLIIVNGNIGSFRRSMLYTEGMTQKYPNLTFIYNPGRRESARQKNRFELTTALKSRQILSELWPKNLKYGFQTPIALNVKGEKFSILCMFGYPKITQSFDESLWYKTAWYKQVNLGHTNDQNLFKPEGSANISHGTYPLWTTPKMCNEEHDKEQKIVKKWYETCQDKKILVTHLNPYQDRCLDSIPYQLYPDIQFNDLCWISSSHVQDIKTNEFRLYSNAGRGLTVRNRVLEV